MTETGIPGFLLCLCYLQCWVLSGNLHTLLSFEVLKDSPHTVHLTKVGPVQGHAQPGWWSLTSPDRYGATQGRDTLALPHRKFLRVFLPMASSSEPPEPKQLLTLSR